jgi:hypothetical protein
MVSISQVAAYWWADELKILNWIANGVIPTPLVAGGLCRWRQRALDKWETDGCPRGEKPSDEVLDSILLAIHNEKGA